MTRNMLNFFDFNGKRISYREQGEGPELFFLHGLAGNSKSWEYQFIEFGASHRVVAWDAPGFGSSDLFPADLDVICQALLSLFKHLRLNNITLIGHSMGGIIATRIAAKNGNFIKSLVLSCTHTGYGEVRGYSLRKQYSTRIKSLVEGRKEDYGDNCAKRMLSSKASPLQFAMASKIASETQIGGLKMGSRIIQETDNRTLIKSLKMPITIITGEQDQVVPKYKNDELRALALNAKHISIKGVGHAPYIESKTEFNKIIKSTMNTL